MYYRIAIQQEQNANWKWKSTVLSSLITVFQFFRLAAMLPLERMLVCSSPVRDAFDDMLVQLNNGLPTTAVPAEQFLQERNIALPVQRWQAVAQQPRAQARITATLEPIGEQSRSEPLSSAPPPTSWLDKRRYELEAGPGGDHDQPYVFTLPDALPQWSAWLTLLSRWQRSEE